MGEKGGDKDGGTHVERTSAHGRCFTARMGKQGQAGASRGKQGQAGICGMMVFMT